QLRQRSHAVGTLEAVLVLDPHHRHALPRRGELVHRAGDGLFAFGDGREGGLPFGLADDGRTGEGHCSPTGPVLGGPDSTVGAPYPSSELMKSTRSSGIVVLPFMGSHRSSSCASARPSHDPAA